MNYDVDYFIRKFEAIPEDKWTVGIQCDGDGRYCAIGHCTKPKEKGNEVVRMYGKVLFPEAMALIILLDTNVGDVTKVNNGKHDAYQQPTPKQRILAALRDIKAKQSPAPVESTKVVTVYRTVMIDSAVKELQKNISEQ